MDTHDLEFICSTLVNDYSDGGAIAHDIERAAQSKTMGYARDVLEESSELYGVSFDTLIVLMGLKLS